MANHFRVILTMWFCAAAVAISGYAVYEIINSSGVLETAHPVVQTLLLLVSIAMYLLTGSIIFLLGFNHCGGNENLRKAEHYSAIPSNLSTRDNK